MKLKTLGAAISVSLALSPMIASADEVDCGVSGTCELPGDTTITDSADPLVQLTLDNLTTQWQIVGDNDGFGMGTTLGSLPFIMLPTSTANSVFIGTNGNIGMSTATPAASLHIRRVNGTAQLRVEEANATVAGRSLLELRNRGAIGFNMINTATSQTWRFATTDTGFRISLDGSGGPEFEVLNNGNAVLRGTLTENSDVNVKSHFAALDGNDVLAKLDAIPVSEWSYKREGSDVRHIGPMAQDFYAAFGLGARETTISPRDMAGVNMAAIKALKAELNEKDAAIAAQQEQIAALQARLGELDQLKAQMAALQSRVSQELPQQVALRN